MKLKHNNRTIEKLKIQRDLLVLILLIIIVCLVGHYVARRRIISPVVDNPINTVVYASEEVSEFEQIVAYITKVFAPEGKHVVVKAIQCFYGESGLRPEARNYNKNGTIDFNIPQINSIHTKRYGDKFKTDWKESINVAYKIYKSRGSFEAWYAPACR